MSFWLRFARFQLVGAGGVIVQLGAVWLLTAAGIHYLLATGLAVAAAVTHNFAWHRRWTWADRTAQRPGWLIHLLQFAAANGTVSLAGNLAVMLVLVGAFGVPVVAANAAAIISCGLVNYWVGDTVVFARRGADRSAAGSSAI